MDLQPLELFKRNLLKVKKDIANCQRNYTDQSRRNSTLMGSRKQYFKSGRFPKTRCRCDILSMVVLALLIFVLQDCRYISHKLAGNKRTFFGGIPLVGADLLPDFKTLRKCRGELSFENEISESKFVRAQDSPSPVKFSFLRRSYLPQFPLKVVIFSEEGHINSFFLQAHEIGKNTSVGVFNTTYSDKDVTFLGCSEDFEVAPNTATTNSEKFRKRSKVTLYWNPPPNFHKTVYFRINALTSDRPNRGWRGLTSVEIVHKGEECYTGDGSSYRGTMSQTKSGLPCQRWDSQTPHSHVFSSQKEEFANDGLESDFCRKPDKDERPWCYTMAEKPSFEACDIPKCVRGDHPEHFVEFGETAGDTKLGRHAGQAGEMNFTSKFPMIKANYNSVSVFEDGVLVLGKDYDSVEGFSLLENGSFAVAGPNSVKARTTAVVAPFWENVRRNASSIGQGYVFVRESEEPDVILTVGNFVTANLRHRTGNNETEVNFRPTWAFIATWHLVGDNASETDVKSLNSFQAVLTTDGNRSFVLFNYDMRKWTDKEHTALVGYKAGDGFRFLNQDLPYTKTSQLENAAILARAVTSQSNVGRAGQMMYEVSMCNQQTEDSASRRCRDSLTLRLKTPKPTENSNNPVGRSVSGSSSSLNGTSNACNDTYCGTNGQCDKETGVCICDAGFTGSQCETNMDDCDSNPCQNGGTCKDGVNEYSCICRPGYVGSRCENDINDCFRAPCQNGGTCIDGVNTYRCDCTSDYTGKNCEKLINQCKSSPCKNGGQCFNTSESFSCDCAIGYSGDQCQFSHCVDGICTASHECYDQQTDQRNCTCRGQGSYEGYCYEVVTTATSSSVCPSSRTGSEPTGYISWPTTVSGGTAISSCPTPTSNDATRRCNGNIWEEPDTSPCGQLSSTSRELQSLARFTVVAANASKVAGQILNVTGSNSGQMVAYDISNVADVLLKIVDVIALEGNYQISNDVINTVSNVIEAPKSEMKAASLEFSSNSRLVEVVDKVLLKVEFNEEKNVFLNSTNIKAGISAIDNSGNFSGKSFSLSPNFQPSISDGEDPTSATASIHLPPSIVEEVPSSELTRVQFVVYTSTALFDNARVDVGTTQVTRQNPNFTVYSDHVLSASVGDRKISDLQENITIVISRTNSFYGKGPYCVFYEPPADGGEGTWSTDGCRLRESTDTKTICDCDHLTNFAVIMDVYGTVEYFNEYQQMILRVLTYIGCSLSIFGLLCTLLSYTIFQKIRKEAPAKILICLCAALIAVNVVYLCLQSAYYSSHTTCVAVAAIMHYALLSSLMWMGLEAINMYIALIKVFNTYYRKYMLKMSLVGWGVPLLIVLIAFVIQFTTGVPSYEMNSKTEICWLRREVFYGTLVAPFGIVFLLNSIIYCLVLAQLLGMSSRKLKHLDSSRKIRKPAKRENARKLRGAVGLMALLGISWGFALGTIDKAALTFAYVFVVFNSSQGFWVFIFHCVLKKEVSKSWKKLLFNKGRSLRDGSSRWSRFSSSNTRGSRTTTSSARSMSSSSMKTSYLVPKPSRSVSKSDTSIGMDSKGLDVVIRSNSTAFLNPVFDEPDIGPPPPFPPPPVPKEEERIVKRVPRPTNPLPSTTIATQTDTNFLRSPDSDSHNSMESEETSDAGQNDGQDTEDDERRDSLGEHSGRQGVGLIQPYHRGVVMSPSNESGIYSDASVSSVMSRTTDATVRQNDETNGYDSVKKTPPNDNNENVGAGNEACQRPVQRYAVIGSHHGKCTSPKPATILTDDARNTDSGVSITSEITTDDGRSENGRPGLQAQDSRSSLYSTNSNTSSNASATLSGSEFSTSPRLTPELPTPHLWKAPLVIKRSEDPTNANKGEGIFQNKPVPTGQPASAKRAMWKKSRKSTHSLDDSDLKTDPRLSSNKRKFKRKVPKSNSIDEGASPSNGHDVEMTNFSLNRGSFHDGAL